MKTMRLIRNMNVISTFMRNAGFSKVTITIVNMSVLVLSVVAGLIFFGFIITQQG